MPEITLEVARQYVMDITGIEVVRAEDGVFRMRKRDGAGQWGEAVWVAMYSTTCQLYEALVNAHFGRFKAEAHRDLLKAQLDAIEKQRAKWRASKRKGRKLSTNPQRYNPSQESIYGEAHVAELTEEITPQ